jgi:DNA-binding response OmpR family regulator
MHVTTGTISLVGMVGGPRRPARILVIDDDLAVRESVRMILEYDGAEFLGASTASMGLLLAEREKPDLVLLDVHMPGAGGFEVLRRLRLMTEPPLVVMISADDPASTRANALGAGAIAFLEKPFESLDRLRTTIQCALEMQPVRTS